MPVPQREAHGQRLLQILHIPGHLADRFRIVPHLCQTFVQQQVANVVEGRIQTCRQGV